MKRIFYLVFILSQVNCLVQAGSTQSAHEDASQPAVWCRSTHEAFDKVTDSNALKKKLIELLQDAEQCVQEVDKGFQRFETWARALQPTDKPEEAVHKVAEGLDIALMVLKPGSIFMHKYAEILGEYPELHDSLRKLEQVFVGEYIAGSFALAALACDGPTPDALESSRNVKRILIEKIRACKVCLEQQEA